MLLQNQAKRLIIINGKHDVTRDKNGDPLGHKLMGKSWKLLPAGAPVEVPDEVCQCAYVNNLIKSGDVVSSGALVIDSTAEEVDEVDEELEALREECDLLDIPWRKNAKAETLKQKIAEAEKELSE